jgi:hypothetical protein
VIVQLFVILNQHQVLIMLQDGRELVCGWRRKNKDILGFSLSLMISLLLAVAGIFRQKT